METEECAWQDLFDDSERKSLDEGFFLIGMELLVKIYESLCSFGI